MNPEKKKRMEELIREISRASYAYYVLDDPYISDMQWDRLYDELKALEKETGEVLPDSPTHKVGGETLKGFEEHTHISRLWSMDKVQSVEELDAWISRTEKPQVLRVYLRLILWRDCQSAACPVRACSASGSDSAETYRTLSQTPCKRQNNRKNHIL